MHGLFDRCSDMCCTFDNSCHLQLFVKFHSLRWGGQTRASHHCDRLDASLTFTLQIKRAFCFKPWYKKMRTGTASLWVWYDYLCHKLVLTVVFLCRLCIHSYFFKKKQQPDATLKSHPLRHLALWTPVCCIPDLPTPASDAVSRLRCWWMILHPFWTWSLTCNTVCRPDGSSQMQRRDARGRSLGLLRGFLYSIISFDAHWFIPQT